VSELHAAVDAHAADWVVEGVRDFEPVEQDRPDKDQGDPLSD
jgi:hypothetical protein